LSVAASWRVHAGGWVIVTTNLFPTKALGSGTVVEVVSGVFTVAAAP
jgi:hypothetical protein